MRPTAKSELKTVYEVIWNQCVEVAKPPKTLYHYCPQDVLPKILSSGNLRASDVLCMNDRREVAYAFNDVIAPIVSQRELGDPKYFIDSLASPDLVRGIWGRFCTYIACFSSTAELPSQWRNYAKSAGYAIGFDYNLLQTWCTSRGVVLFPVIYEGSRQSSMITRFFDREKEVERSRHCPRSTIMKLRDQGRIYLASLAMTLKEPSWRSECEWRVQIIEPDRGNRFVRLRRDDGVHFVELPICAGGVMSEIVLGPQCGTGAAELRRQLDDAGFGSVSVRRCTCGCEKDAGDDD
jgi:hypothetical protein